MITRNHLQSVVCAALRRVGGPLSLDGSKPAVSEVAVIKTLDNLSCTVHVGDRRRPSSIFHVIANKE